MKIIALEQELPGVTPEQFDPHSRDEAVCIWELNRAGILREACFHANRPEAVLVLECANPREAQTIRATLPLAQAGLITFEVMPLVPYPGFARLFNSGSGFWASPTAGFARAAL